MVKDKSSILTNIQTVNGKTIFQAESKGDELAMQVVGDWIYHIAWGLSIIAHSLNPGIIIIGGGISREGEYLIARIRHEVIKMTMPSFVDSLEIVPAMLANDAGIIGAAYTVLQKEN